jgi:hypothetical protein
MYINQGLEYGSYLIFTCPAIGIVNVFVKKPKFSFSLTS